MIERKYIHDVYSKSSINEKYQSFINPERRAINYQFPNNIVRWSQYINTVSSDSLIYYNSFLCTRHQRPLFFALADESNNVEIAGHSREQ